jgi:hypothetical protein
MDAELKAKWVKALRSGRYKQVAGTLKRGEKHCCLGVLYRIQRGDFKELRNNLMSTELPEGYSGGLTQDQRNDLAARNDGTFSPATKVQHEKQSFREIADYIDKHL